jgi:hypothetical protein
MDSSLTYREGVHKLQLALEKSICLPGKMRDALCEMSLREMLSKVDVTVEADIVAIGTLIGKQARLKLWQNAMMQCGIEFPTPKRGPGDRKVAFKYWWCPTNLVESVPQDKLNTRIVAERVAATLEAAAPATAAVPDVLVLLTRCTFVFLNIIKKKLW